ncbi:rRNA maturation RNase YbeY [Rhodoplanes roseus]|uniref:Endoribonuclease YbeY n=1 Tax=Rhodoplanes roseus TaxID=29409 RepID=A0A327KRD0_9BRAD|nr:rRNA maturation RNase YbeY [Rhodoplanes roseus]RAI40496.1 rRNA maturation RNase YbeY [Rhodoplanes roseus]
MSPDPTPSIAPTGATNEIGATTVDVVVESPLWAEEPDAEALVLRAVAATLPADRGACELCVVLADDATVQALNARYRGKDAPTNVLSFPAVPGGTSGDADPDMPTLLGDVVLAYETVRAESQRDGTPFAHHLGHLVVHGVLHLLGYDHETDAEAELMEARERDVLASLDVPDPYAGRECA